jgi:hypothetical protein
MPFGVGRCSLIMVMRRLLVFRPPRPASGKSTRLQQLFNDHALSWHLWGLGLTMSKRQCERFDGAIPFLLRGSMSSTGSTTRCAGAPQNSGKAKGLIEISH